MLDTMKTVIGGIPAFVTQKVFLIDSKKYMGTTHHMVK